MHSILLKRRAMERQQKERDQALQKTSIIEPVSLPINIHRSKLLDKPWDEKQATLKEDIARLRTLAGSQEKDPYKQELVNKYRPLVEELLMTHSDLRNLEMVWWFYQWQIDLGQLVQMHDDFRNAIDKGLESPSNWRSNAQTAYCDIVFKYSFDANKAKKEFKKEYLLNAVSDLLKGTLATNAPLKVKMFRLIGNWHYEAEEKEQAHNLFELVMKLDPTKGGVKTKLKELKEELGYDKPH